MADEMATLPPKPEDLHERVFQYLANHTDGTRMTDLEQEFGLARIQMARVLGSLIDGNRVEKRKFLYFAQRGRAR